MTPLSRRRFLTVSASAAALPAFAGTSHSAHWQGVALGAPASLRIEGMTDDQAAPVFSAIQAELDRLEDIFSLYRPASQISRLNRDGTLADPAAELVEVLDLSDRLHAATGGAFDPTVQPLWRAMGDGLTGADLDRARKSVGWSGVQYDAAGIRLTRPDMALTLNGIAQGAITDHIATLLRNRGLADVLIDMGEIAALGHRADGADWTLGVINPQGQILRRVMLSNRALATSAPSGTPLTETQGHILGPQGEVAQADLVSVSAPAAALADGLSTALCLLAPEAADAAIAHFPEARLEHRT